MVDRNMLQRLPIFSALPVDDLQRLAAALRVQHFRRNDILFNEGDPGLGVWLTLAGQVKLVKTDSAGGEQLLKVVGPEHFFAEVVLFDGGTYPATAIAATDCTLAVLYNSDSRALLGANPELAWRFLRIMSQRLRVAQDRIRILSGNDATVRVASILLHLTKEQGHDTIAMSKQDLANMVGMARETVSRVVSELRDQQYIETGRNKITIKNQRLLAALVDSPYP